MKLGRNAPCPCRSGLKYKRCCGSSRERERELERRLDRQAGALEELVTLAQHFPRLRPTGVAFSAWADRIAKDGCDRATFEDGLALIEPAELVRIETEHAAEFPHVWRSLVADLEDERLARQSVVAGAIVAALGEWEAPDPRTLELIEELAHLRADACEALSYVVDAHALWSVRESAEADDTLGAIRDDLDDEAYDEQWHAVLTAEAERLATDWHRGRLAELVGRLRGQLALPGYPAASATLAAACRRFADEEPFRRRLATLLLADSLGRIETAELAEHAEAA